MKPCPASWRDSFFLIKQKEGEVLKVERVYFRFPQDSIAQEDFVTAVLDTSLRYLSSDTRTDAGIPVLGQPVRRFEHVKMTKVTGRAASRHRSGIRISQYLNV